jgi:Zn-dependent protease with chaperone function
MLRWIWHPLWGAEYFQPAREISQIIYSYQDKIFIMRNLALKLTKCWLKQWGLEFKGIRRIKLSDGQQMEVIVFSAGNNPLKAQCTPCNTIILNELLLNNEDFLNRVLIHEMTHKKQWYSWVVYLAVFPIVAGFIVILMAISQLALSIYAMNIGIVFSAGTSFLTGLLLISIPCALSWLSEYKAEKATFQKLGPEKVLAIDTKMKDLFPQKSSIISRILILMTHPPHSFNVKIYRHFNED